MAFCVVPRLFIWGAVSLNRDKDLVRQVMSKVRQASGRVIQPILVAVDGFAAYPKVVKNKSVLVVGYFVRLSSPPIFPDF